MVIIIIIIDRNIADYLNHNYFIIDNNLYKLYRHDFIAVTHYKGALRQHNNLKTIIINIIEIDIEELLLLFMEADIGNHLNMVRAARALTPVQYNLPAILAI